MARATGHLRWEFKKMVLSALLIGGLLSTWDAPQMPDPIPDFTAGTQRVWVPLPPIVRNGKIILRGRWETQRRP